MYSPGDILAETVITILRIYTYIILARVLMSWVIRDPNNPFFRFIYSITEPVLSPIRRILPQMGLDFSPIILYFIINFLIRILSGR